MSVRPVEGLAAVSALGHGLVLLDRKDCQQAVADDFQNLAVVLRDGARQAVEYLIELDDHLLTPNG
jgi:hypothetical protein